MQSQITIIPPLHYNYYNYYSCFGHTYTDRKHSEQPRKSRRQQSVLIQIIEVKVQQASRIVNIFIIEGNKSITQVERDCRRIRINGDKPASCLIVNRKVSFNEIEQE